MAFTHLHLHTIYSFLDGLVKPAELMTRLKVLGMDSVAITDHGNMHGAIDFYVAAKEKGIKAIIGMESYIASGSRLEKSEKDQYHLVLLAKNEQGYKNLCLLSSQSFIDGFYYKPRIDREILRDHCEGIIATSACLGGEIPKALEMGNRKKALYIAKEYQELFGADNFFLELQVNGLKEQVELNIKLLEMGKELGIPFVATNDVHYLTAKHAVAQDILFCINEKKKVEDMDRMHYETDQFYLKSEEEMRALFAPVCMEAVDNTSHISKMCDLKIETDKSYLPHYDTGGIELGKYLADISETGLKKRFADDGLTQDKWPEYHARLSEELKIISDMKFPGYFLIVADFIRWAKDNDVPVGPGRGSGAGSLVAYATRITDIDPLLYGLFFERFLNPERISMPDFDIDFCQDKRELVIQYVTNKYGKERVAQIATYSKMKAKSAVRDVARVLNIDLGTANKLAKIVPDDLDDLINPQFSLKTKKITADIADRYAIAQDETADVDVLRNRLKKLKAAPDDQKLIDTIISSIDQFEKERQLINNTPDYKKIIDVASQIEGLLRQPGKHAAGIVISDKPIHEYSPIFMDKEDNRITQYDKNFVEKVGLVKFDFLGLKTLTMIRHAERLIKRRVPGFDISRIPLDDKGTYKMLWDKSTKGVFQSESAGFEKMLHQMKPDRIHDLIAGVALYRPGPMDIIPNYIRRKHGKETVEYDHQWLEEILKETYGLIVYQEQVMQISVKMAGFSMGGADTLRKAMGKKEKAKMAKMREQFIEGAKLKNVEAAIAEKVFDLMAKFAEYGFNKSHAAAYGLICYQTAYLKKNYPQEFFSALISSESNRAEKVFSYISDAKSMGINIYPPDVNSSELDFSIQENSIRFGLGAIKNAGEGAVEEIITERNSKGSYKSLFDFTSRVNQSKVNARTVEYLIRAGAFDFTGINRGTLTDILPQVAKAGEKNYQDKISGQMSLFGAMGLDSQVQSYSDDAFTGSSSVTWDIFDTLMVEKEILGVYVTNHPAQLFKKDIKNLGFEMIEDITENTEHKGRSRNKIWIAGVISTDIKPQKGREGDYFLKGIIEGFDSTIEFTINRIENPTANPAVEKLKSKIPLAFRINPRTVFNKDDDSVAGVSASIEDIESDILTLPEYIAKECAGTAKAVLEAGTDSIAKNIELIRRLTKKFNESDMEMPLTIKISYPEKKAHASLERNTFISEKKLKELKENFGSDNFYILRKKSTL